MANIPLSQVTIIATTLGIFFLIVAFYKSIFHKRRHPSKSEIPETDTPKPADKGDEPIKLADPFQQVPVDQLPRPQAPQSRQTPTASAPFYPSMQRPNESSVSAFRQFNPKKEFETAVASSKNDATYEWE